MFTSRFYPEVTTNRLFFQLNSTHCGLLIIPKTCSSVKVQFQPGAFHFWGEPLRRLRTTLNMRQIPVARDALGLRSASKPSQGSACPRTEMHLCNLGPSFNRIGVEHPDLRIAGDGLKKVASLPHFRTKGNQTCHERVSPGGLHWRSPWAIHVPMLSTCPSTTNWIVSPGQAPSSSGVVGSSP